MMRHRRHNLRIRLPELTAREAAALSYLIDQIDNALWAAYGPKMTALCEREGIPLIASDSDRAPTSDNERER
jgi:hypothetical protein